MGILATITGAAGIVAQFEAAEARYMGACTKAMERTLVHGTSLVKANASGSPGPQIRTSDYNGSIDWRMEAGDRTVKGWIGTNRPQGRRLELGFHGVDSLGRSYNQGPFPHFGPAVPAIQETFEANVAAAVKAAS